MRAVYSPQNLRNPLLLDKSTELAMYISHLSYEQIMKIMHVSESLAKKTLQLLQNWSSSPIDQTTAIDSFIGDVYSGLQVKDFSVEDREYADATMWILSGLYGLIRPLDGIYPYRLEMGYSFPDSDFKNLYAFWGDTIANQLPKEGVIVNLSSVEYSKVITPYVEKSRIVTPIFLTVNQKTHIPIFTAVHAKIARGAFAHWLIKNRITDPTHFSDFSDLGYIYDKTTSTPLSPVFICQTFGGLGLSIRLD